MMFRDGDFVAHSGRTLPWKIDCDALTDDDLACLAKLVGGRFPVFSEVIGVPRGGLRFAEALRPYAVAEAPMTIVVDDVLTTGRSMEDARKSIKGPSCGIVIYARGPLPRWVKAVFVVSPWLR